MTNTASSWFAVDKEGLAKILERRGKHFAVCELIQNAWDEEATTEVSANLTPENGPYARLVVEDNNPAGFADLSHAYTLFAESSKKGAPTKRGRFNLGEKLVLALCTEAQISTTTGTVYFGATGKRNQSHARTMGGSVFSARIRMTRDELAQTRNVLRTLIPPVGITTRLLFGTKTEDIVVLPPRTALRRISIALPTEIADADGYLLRRLRQTTLDIHEPLPGETGTLYEMGIPVVETGDRYHVDVAQKIPLSMERDNVTPSYLREIRAAVLNAMATAIKTPEQANEAWVRDAASNPKCTDEAITSVVSARFGTKRVAADPNDPEATRIAASRGYEIIYGGSMSAGEWENVRRAGAALPASQVTPSPKPFHTDGEPLKMVLQKEWTAHLTNVAEYVTHFAKVVDLDIELIFANDREWGFAGAYSKRGAREGRLTLNLHKASWATAWGPGNQEALDQLLFHELAHHWGDHLEESYHEAICRLAARALRIATHGRLVR